MNTTNFFSELKRRQVYRGGVMYVVAGWVIVQVATTLFPIFNIPDWAIRLVVVGLILGFPLALVALWMFESQAGRPAETAAASPPPLERRRSSDRGDGGIAQLMERERAERQQANEQLIAALDRIHSSQHDAHHPVPEAAPATAGPAPGMETPVRSRRPRAGAIFLALFSLVLVAWVLWILVAPSVSLEPVADTNKLTHEYVMPAYKQAEQVGAALLDPLLRRLGVGIPPERAFTALMMVVALLVLRNLYRSMARARRRRAGRA